MDVGVQVNLKHKTYCANCGHQTSCRLDNSENIENDQGNVNQVQTLLTYYDFFMPKAYMNVQTFKKYVAALRPWSFSASFTPVILGMMLAYKSTGDFSYLILIATSITAISVHAAGNLVNTYMDYINGVDTNTSEDRTLVNRILTPQQVLQLGTITYCLACIGCVTLIWLSAAQYQHIALLFFGGLSSSFLYTGGFGLKYLAFGDIVIILAFGPLTVMFSFLAQTGQLSIIPLFYAIPLALNTEAILHCNNTRDIVTDQRAGIVTLAILLGPTLGYLLFVFLLFSPYIIISLMAISYDKWLYLPVLTVTRAFHHERSFRRGELMTLPQEIAKLNLLLGILYVFACYMTNGESLPSLMTSSIHV